MARESDTPDRRSVSEDAWTCRWGIRRPLQRENGVIVHTGDSWHCRSCGDWVCGYCENVHGDDEPSCPHAGPVHHAAAGSAAA